MTDADIAALHGTWLISDEELEKANNILDLFHVTMFEAFGGRAQIVMTNAMGSMLGHWLAEANSVDMFAISETINDWLRAVSKTHGWMPMELVLPGTPHSMDHARPRKARSRREIRGRV